jgi:RES domain-containing protein
MQVYRLSKRKWANQLNGEGARLHGGRWNLPGIACIYAAESRALAVLEYTVNISIDDIPRDLVFARIDIPSQPHIIQIADLPGDWNTSPAPVSAKKFGSTLLASHKHLIIRFPSVILPGEFNYIIDPLHRDFQKIDISGTEDFVYDLRIKG